MAVDNGSPPEADARAIATGTTIFALAVLLVNSLVNTATTEAAPMRTHPLVSLGSHAVRPFPMASARPV